MSKKNIVKYILDIILAIGFVLMYDKMATGINLHELLGLGLGIGVIVHVILNYKWVISIGKRIFSKDISIRIRLLYVINILLLICMILIMVGGIFISKTILTNISSQNQGLWKGIHVAVSNIALILIGIHVGLNFSWIKGITKKIFKIKESKKYGQIISRILVVAILLFGSYNISSQRFLQRTIMVFKMVEGQPMGEMSEIGKGGDMKAPSNIEGSQDKSLDEIPQMPQKPDFDKDSMSEEEINKFDENMKNREKPQGINGKLSKGKTSIISLVINHLSIASVFAIIAYYIDQFMKKRKEDNGGI